MSRAVLFDVDGTLVDSMANLRHVWRGWAEHYGLDGERVWACAKRTAPLATFAEVAPDQDPADCIAKLHELEDEDARSGDYSAFPTAAELLWTLPADGWGVVTSNYRHRTLMRFDRLGLPAPRVLVDAASVRHGKPDPEGYLAAAHALGRAAADCLVIEDSPSGVEAGVRARMTVWSVGATAVDNAHRHHQSLEAAVADIRDWLAR